MEGKQSQRLWYVLVASGALVLGLLVASVAGPQMLSNSTPKYKVTFFQTPTCGSQYALPWAVTLGDSTIQKGGGDLPTDGNRALTSITPTFQSKYLNETFIVFYVPNGTYNFSLRPWGDFWDPVTFPQGIVNGTVHVGGHGTSINVTVASNGVCSY
jgi:hypothetical protein